jgi:hypothetical protein
MPRSLHFLNLVGGLILVIGAWPIVMGNSDVSTAWVLGWGAALAIVVTLGIVVLRSANAPDSSAAWPAAPNLEVVFDTATQRLCGVSLGSDIHSAARFGPPENRHPTRDLAYDYYQRGLSLCTEDGAIVEFLLVFLQGWGFSHGTKPPFAPFTGTIERNGESLPITPRTTLDEFVALFGEPWWRDDDEDETILFYEFRPNVEWQVEFNPQQTLAAWTITSAPLMAGEDQRRAYHVTKPWPPR